MENPPNKYFRLSPGKEVRLKYAYIIQCNDVIRDEKTGEVIELHCTYDPNTRSGHDTSGKKVKGTLHWVSAVHGIEAEVRLYDHLYIEDEDSGEQSLNPDSRIILKAMVEPSLQSAETGKKYQFMRHGYFSVDPDTDQGHGVVFNRIVSLRDTWAKMQNK